MTSRRLPLRFHGACGAGVALGSRRLWGYARADRRASLSPGKSDHSMQLRLNRISELGRMIFGTAIVALGAEHLVCANMAVQPFPAQFHAIVIPVIPWIPAHPWLAYVTGAALLVAGSSMLMNVRARAGALLSGGILLGADLILHLPRMLVVPQNWGLRGEVCELLALSSAAFVLAGRMGGCVVREHRPSAVRGRGGGVRRGSLSRAQAHRQPGSGVDARAHLSRVVHRCRHDRRGREHRDGADGKTGRVLARDDVPGDGADAACAARTGGSA